MWYKLTDLHTQSKPRNRNATQLEKKHAYKICFFCVWGCRNLRNLILPLIVRKCMFLMWCTDR